MSATFAATFSAVAVSAAQDVFELVAPSTSRVAIRSISLGQYSDAGDAQAEMLSVPPDARPHDVALGRLLVTPGNVEGRTNAASAGSTVEANNTTVASNDRHVASLSLRLSKQLGCIPLRTRIVRRGHRRSHLCLLVLAMPSRRILLLLFVLLTGAAAPQNGASAELEQEVESFLTEVYFKAGYPLEIDPADLYSNVVDYWGEHNMSRARVLRRKDSYYRRWPIRKFYIRPMTTKVIESALRPGRYAVEFRYFFEVSGENGTREGEATGRLVLIGGGSYGFLIRSEDGSVNTRF